MHAIRFVFAICAIGLLCSCGSSSSPTYDLQLSISETTAANLAKANSTKAVDPSNWKVACVSTRTAENRTVRTGEWNSSVSKFVVTDIPSGQGTVCYLEEDGVAFSTIQYSDNDAIGSRRDGSKLISDGAGTISYAADSSEALIAEGSGVEAPNAEDRTVLNGEWAINCSKIKNIITDEEDTTQSCSPELSDMSIFPHLIAASDSASKFKISYGLWMSHDAYQACGSTEGLDNLPSSWTLDSSISPTMANAFSWDAPFAAFTYETSSADIFTMIKAANVDGMTTFTTFKNDPENAEFCTDTDDVCAAKYYETVMREYGRENHAAVCWPDLIFNWTANGVVTASAWSDLGSKARPLSRYALAEAYKNGQETYMRSFETQIKNVAGEAGSAECVVNSELLIAIITPGGDPDNGHAIISPGGDPTPHVMPVGTTNSTRFMGKTTIASTDNTTEGNNLCQSYLGSSDEKIRRGFFAQAEMVMINPLPTP